MKVSKTVSIDFELLQMVLNMEENFSKAVAEALEEWLTRKLEAEKWSLKEPEKRT